MTSFCITAKFQSHQLLSFTKFHKIYGILSHSVTLWLLAHKTFESCLFSNFIAWLYTVETLHHCDDWWLLCYTFKRTAGKSCKSHCFAVVLLVMTAVAPQTGMNLQRSQMSTPIHHHLSHTCTLVSSLLHWYSLSKCIDFNFE